MGLDKGFAKMLSEAQMSSEKKQKQKPVQWSGSPPWSSETRGFREASLPQGFTTLRTEMIHTLPSTVLGQKMNHLAVNFQLSVDRKSVV